MTLFAKRLFRQLITHATETLYSEQFEFNAIVSKLSRKRPGVHALRAYVAIQTATRLVEPLDDAEVNRAFSALRASERHVDSPDFGRILDVHKELANIYWLQKQKDILKRKLAHKNNEHSYEGTIYSLEFSKKGPTARQERAKYEPLCREMAELERQIEEQELKALKEANDPSYQDAKTEIDARALSEEVDTNEDEALARELQDIAASLQSELESLLYKD